jgi:hypothetical protein
MPIPSRFQLTPPSKSLVREMCNLCSEISRLVEQREDPSVLLAQWHRHANHEFKPVDFVSYAGAVDQETFVRDALNPRPRFVADLQYSEAAAVLESVVLVDVTESESSHFLEWLDVQFPGIGISDLIYWPDQWFDNPLLIRDAQGGFRPEAELSTDQVLGYAMAKSGRALPGAPAGVVLPFPVPKK